MSRIRMFTWQTVLTVVIALVLLITSLLLNSNVFASSTPMGSITITGNRSELVFTTDFDTPQGHILWGLPGTPKQDLTFNGTVARVNPPEGVATFWFAPENIEVITDFQSLGDGWYQIPLVGSVVISGNLSELVFTANFDHPQGYILWGSPGIPRQDLTFNSNTAKVTPPNGVVAFWFAPEELSVTTDFLALGDGWYQIPPVNIFIPLILN